MKKLFKKTWAYRYVILFVVWLLYIINYLDRFAVIVFMPYIQDDLNLSPEQAGLILSIFFIPYALSQVTSGFLADKFGPKKVMGVAITVFTVATALTGFVKGFGQMIALRLGLALGEGHHFPPGTKAISNWFPRKSRGSALSFFSTTYVVAPAIAPILLTAASFYFFGGAWRPVFFLLVIPGLIGMFLLWYFVADTPEQMQKKGRVSQDEVDFINDDVEEGAVEVDPRLKSPKIFLTDKVFYFGVFVCVFQVALSWGIASWLPTILVKQYGLDIKNMGILVALPYITGIISILLGGWLMDKFKSMKMVALIAYGGCIPIMFLFSTVEKGDNTMLVILLLLAGFFVNLNYGPLLAFLQNRYPKEVAGSAVGTGNGIGQFGAFFAPFIAGYLVKVSATGEYDFSTVFLFFMIVAILAFIGAVLLNEKPIHIQLEETE
ncbi:MFS transporter [Sporosarcina sp. BI001-red]|uniref:MFS transporter n=1 Tax=Sporosarcina sp. BI001-red TaxID=2282866 RepID=UPI000E24048D|nr:MFS transporter [Sporosarcina sp. BI001-red]REB08744.1 MFS transporter [Sporosarcina sp. BI001-red]